MIGKCFKDHQHRYFLVTSQGSSRNTFDGLSVSPLNIDRRTSLTWANDSTVITGFYNYDMSVYEEVPQEEFLQKFSHVLRGVIKKIGDICE